jgi:hypothetical protein
MAPLKPRQNHSLTPSTPRPPKGPSVKPVPVTTSIDPKVFGELFAGVVTIFFLAVIFWKTGKFIRSFNQHKVLKEGKPTTARYARTWYGWVSLKTHERNKKMFSRIHTRVREWTAWKSTNADYRWVWWDPGNEALEERRRNRKLLAWLPECFKSYEFATADEIWNPGPLTNCHGARSEERSQSVWLTLSLRRRRGIDRSPLSRQCFEENEVNGGSSMYRSTSSSEKRPAARTCHKNWVKHLLSNSEITKQLSKLSNKSQSLPISRNTSRSPLPLLSSSTVGIDLVTNRDPSCSEPASFRTARTTPYSRSHEALNTSMQIIDRTPYQHPDFRAYRVWSTQMQLKASGPEFRDFRDSSGPPGTPRTSILGSFFSEQSTSDVVPERPTEHRLRHLDCSIGGLSVTFSQDNFDRHSLMKRARLSYWGSSKFKTAPTRVRFLKNTSPLTARGFHRPWYSLRESSQPLHARNVLGDLWPFVENVPQSPVFNDQPKPISISAKVPFEELSDWEVRLIDVLDRKLIWIFNEFTPGQKPYHFACLANHWLNHETWVVIDPVSRVSQDARRKWGDPRFNVPYPEPCLDPRPKYPLVVHKRANIRRIDSWRAAVNRQRRVSGVRDIVRRVELYEDSYEEPPDGKIDTASWILPRPPQGFEMSTKQKNAWYEGGAGWQEKLEDWQQVRRGYRLRKGLYEGCVNRNHLKEVAADVGRCCRTVSSKLIPDFRPTRRYSQPIC